MKKRILSSILATLLSTQLATAEQAQKSEQPTEKIEEKDIVKKDIFLEMKILKESLQRSPKDYSLRHKLGVLCLKIKDYEKATELIEELLEKDPTNEVAHVLYGEVLLKKGEIQKAKEEFAEGGEPGLIHIATHYINQNDFVNAKNSLEKVLIENKEKQMYKLSIMKDEKPIYTQKATEDDVAKAYLTKIKFLEGKVDEAKNDFIEMFGKDDEMFEAFCLSGGIYFELNFQFYYKSKPKEKKLGNTI